MSDVSRSIMERCLRIGFVGRGDEEIIGRSRAAAVFGEGLGVGAVGGLSAVWRGPYSQVTSESLSLVKSLASGLYEKGDIEK